MKRSEMTRLIWDAINELEDAEHILKCIEEAGMLPPKIHVVDGDTLSMVQKHEWEAEEASIRNYDDYTSYEEWRKSHGAE